MKIRWFCNKYYISNGISKKCKAIFKTEEVKTTHCPCCNNLLNVDKDKVELLLITRDKEYIGYNDSNGNKIHEGDLISWFGVIALVEWDEKYKDFVADVGVDIIGDTEFELTTIVNNIT